ncbi:MAG: hypothetical protein QXU88_02420 [Candidatus Woesearchaeota archaeon]
MPKPASKRMLTASEEFEIMKLVLDKWLLAGIVVLLYGFYLTVSRSLADGFYYFVAGIVLLLLFVWFLKREFEHVR